LIKNKLRTGINNKKAIKFEGLVFKKTNKESSKTTKVLLSLYFAKNVESIIMPVDMAYDSARWIEFQLKT
jgi:hypothetical protein